MFGKDDLYFSVVVLGLRDIKDADVSSLFNGSDRLYFWAFWDNYPSRDLKKSPVFFGVTTNVKTLNDLYSRYVLQNSEFIIDNEGGFNKNFYSRLFDSDLDFITYPFSTKKLVSFYKVGDFYSYAEWDSMLRYMTGLYPDFFEMRMDIDQLSNRIADVSEERMKAYMKNCGVTREIARSDFLKRITMNSSNSSYIKFFLKKQDFLKKSNTTINNSGIKIVYFLYSITESNGKLVFVRHRIIKETKKHIFVEKYPYIGGSFFMGSDFVFFDYAVKIDLSIKEDGFFRHKSLSKTFYTGDYYMNNKSAFSKIEKGFDDFFEQMGSIDLDTTYDGWALELLELKKDELTLSNVKKAFVRASLKHHPDRGGDATLFIKCVAARDFLIDLIES